MSKELEPTDETREDKSRTAIIRDYFIGGNGREFDTYRNPELYDAGAHSHLYRRDNLARGVADVALAHLTHDQSSPRILDIGAGTGILSLELAGRNVTVTALDLFKPQLARLKEKANAVDLANNVLPVQADMNNGLPFADDSFEAVVSLRATRYIDNFDNWLDEVHRVLEPGGSFVLPVFAIDTIPWKRNSDKGIRQPTTHDNVKAAVREAGFKIDEAASIGYSEAVDLNLDQRDVPFYYKPNFVVAKVDT
jgi:SAM-dependent methyltransferase